MQVEEIQVGRTYRSSAGRTRTVTVVRMGFNDKMIVRYTTPTGHYPFYQTQLEGFAKWAHSVIPEEVGND